MQSANVAVLFEREIFVVALYPLIYWELISPLLSSSRSVALLLFHLLLSLVRALASNRLVALSFSTVCVWCQVVLGWPTFLLSIGVQVSAVAQWCSLGILRMYPKNLHLLFFASILNFIHPVLSLSSSVNTTYGQNMPRLLLKHYYWEEASCLLSWTLVFHVSLPYNRTGLTKLLPVNSLVLVLLLVLLNFLNAA